MAITSGFFNAVNHDRLYDATHFSSIFNGIINDGVFMSVGNALMVKPSSNNDITIDIGRCWFDGTWMYNDAILPMTTTAANAILDRIDAVVVEVNHSDSVRDTTIKMVDGVAASTAARPTLTKTNVIKQYPLAYIYRKAGSTTINQADITNMVGTSECPYVTGILKTIDATQLIAQWQDQWNIWYSNTKVDWAKWFRDSEAQWEAWYANETSTDEEQWDTWFNNLTTTNEADIADWTLRMKTSFNNWFDGLQVTLTGDIAAKMAAQIYDLEQFAIVNAVNKFVSRTTVFNNDGSIVCTDNKGNKCTTIFNADGSISERYETVDHGIVTKKTVFNSDGSVTEVIE